MAKADFNARAARRVAMTAMRGVCGLVLGLALLSGGAGRSWAAGGQTAPETKPAAHPAHPHRAVRGHAAPPETAPAAPLAAPAPVEPERPKWPANEAPNQPSVKWDSNGLTISAFNASLSTILSQVSSETGAKVEGLVADERVFGDYGPGQARDVLAQLLHGSNYDYLMLGDEGQGTPREIVLSTRHAGSATADQGGRPATENQDEDYQPDQDEQGQPPVFRPQMAPPQQMMPPRTPQQRFEEMRQRQLQMQQQQQQMPPEQQQPPSPQ